MKINRAYYSGVLFMLSVTLVSAQNYTADTTTLNKARLKSVVIGCSVLYPASLITLDKLWYKDFPREGFHFFNDAQEWKQVDKIGHAYSSFQLSSMGAKSLQWSGVPNNKSYIWGGVMGLLFMTPIEIMDGYSSEYGASTTDFAFNILGTALFTSQGLMWNEIRIHPKFSFSRSDFASQRPNTLGSGLKEEILKDYNGQTYWLSFDVSKMIAKDNNFPKWINLAIGYGAHDMVYASDDVNMANGLTSYRQYYLSIDFDLHEIETRSKWIKSLIYFVNMIHLPSPALEFNSKGEVKFHSLKF